MPELANGRVVVMGYPMSSSPIADAIPETPPGDLAEAGVYRTFAEGSDHGLVVLAMGESYWLLPHGEEFRLLVEPRVAAAVGEQLSRFDRESRRWPPVPIADQPALPHFELLLPLLWATCVLALFLAQSVYPGWTARGALDAAALFTRGEWWRPFTALFLHGSGDHVIANAVSGLLVFSAVLTTFGRGRGLLLLGVAAVVANTAIAALHFPEEYRSLGASTAIFAGVGLLTGRAARLVARSTHPHRWRLLFVPLAAGLTVLALYGGGGLHESVDIGAHVAGFVVGGLAGFLGANLKAAGREVAHQR
jgi:rhomboid protease GluP